MSKISIHPARNLAFFNEVVNHPEVYPSISDDMTPPMGEFSISDKLSKVNNVFLEVRNDQEPVGFFALLQRATGVYEVHTNFLPSFRGSSALRAAIMGMDWMFINTNAHLLTSYSWETAPATALFARLAGMKEDARRPHPIPVGGKTVESTWLSISLHEWIRGVWRRYVRAGQIFHEKLFAEQEHESHPEDPNHDGMVGLALTMGLGGNPIKAETIYNEWAARSGYAAVRFAGQRGPFFIIDIQDSVIEIDAELNVILVERRK